MSERQFKSGPSFWLSLGLILIGIYLLLENFGILYLGNLWNYWPLILVAVGLIKLIGSNFKDIYSPVIMIVVGFVFFLLTMNYLYWDQVWQFWPLILIVIGGKIIWNHYLRENRPGYRESMSSEDRIDSVSIFSGREARLNSERFEGGNITSVFGGAEIDFNGSRLAPGKSILDVFIMFGGAELYVPRNWNVVMKGMPIFGGFEDARKNLPTEEFSSEDVLIIKGLILFGGLTVKDSV
jgi:predicted membrane protein